MKIPYKIYDLSYIALMVGVLCFAYTQEKHSEEKQAAWASHVFQSLPEEQRFAQLF